MKYDALIIGTGQGGNPLAGALAKAGRRTAIIERAEVGGSCINDGCTPTKTMVASARVAHLVGRAGDYGVRTGSVSMDMTKVRERKRALVERFRSGSEKGLESTNHLDLIRGEAAFVDSNTVRVQKPKGEIEQLSAELIVINTGLQPALPPIEGLKEVPTLDNASIMELDEVPEHLLVLGGGYVGLEFAQMFRRFGSAVTLMDRGEQLLSQEDPDIAEEVANILRDEGIEILLQSTAQKVQQNGDGIIRMTVETPDGERTLDGSHLLVAVGRVPNTQALNLQAAGIGTDDRGFIKVNERLETNVPGIYALGDVKGGPAFTHVSYHDYRILQTNLLEGGEASIAGRPVLYTVFIDPQLGRMGLTEQQARQQGRKIRVAKLPLNQVARALETDQTRGLMKAIVDAESEQILGCAIFSPEGGEIMSMIQIAMRGQVPYTALRDGMFAHPLWAEAFNSLFAAFEE
ncbi:mercuric reductase [Nitrosococcus wardiae]|uniref:Mercuric reductase n=1 Tax=Nitrosococcus wardiae TaxID=1814290 RepID=A0A4P7C0R0_9GAMM|nr:mercuric reductase [Nitrosococcus wardiae]QBQ54316.1 mercuric reductase [Nitrosococcus wardiae]